MSNFILKNEYTSKEECKAAIAKYNEGKLPEEKMRYCSYLNMVTRKRMYVPCSIEYFHAWRNMMAEEHRKRDLETRCLISSERYSYLKSGLTKTIKIRFDDTVVAGVEMGENEMTF